MNRQPTREEVQRYLERMQQLKAEYGQRVGTVPEFVQLQKIMRFIQMQAFQRQPMMRMPNAGQMPQMSPQMQGQMQPSQMGMPYSNGQQMPQGQSPSAASTGVPNTPLFSETPFSALQLQALKAQGQAAEYLMKAPQNGFQPMPQALLDVATNERLIVADNSPMRPMQLPQTVQNQVLLQQPVGFDQFQSLNLVAGQNNTQLGSNQLGSRIGQNSLMGPAQMRLNMAPNSQPQTGQSQAQSQLAQNSQMSQGSRLGQGQLQGQLQGPLQNQIQTQMGQSQSPNQNPAIAQQAIRMSPMGQSMSPNPNSQIAPTPASQSPAIPIRSLSVQSQRQNLSLSQAPKQPPLNPQSIQGLNRGTPRPDKEPETTRPVPRKAQMPVEFSQIDAEDQLVVPVSKPGVQVDAYVFPKILQKDKKVPFMSLLLEKSRVHCPAILPTAVDINEIVANRRAVHALQDEEWARQLKEKLSDATDPFDREMLEAELAEIELVDFQKEVRGRILSQVWFSRSLLPNSHPNFLAKFSNLLVENVIATEELYKQQLMTRLQAQNKRHHTLVSRILSHKTRRQERVVARKEKAERTAARVGLLHAQTAKEEQKKLEKMAKQRLQALRLNDEEAYLKLLDKTKDTRITHLLNQTNQFLDSLSQAVQTQQNQAKGVEEPAENREKVDYYQVAHRVKEEVLLQPEMLVGGQLKEYQLKGLQWMVSLYNNHLNGILADEMGLGKTIQLISLITYLVERKSRPGPYLVIVPLSTLTNWNIEFEKWAPLLKKITFKGTPTQRRAMQPDIRTGNFQVLLTTFDYIIRDKNILSKVRWVHMIIDEGHRMKNLNLKLSETLTQSYHSDYRLILTGTPLQNNLPELWLLLNFVLPKIFNSVKLFDEWFNTPFANTGGQDKIELSEEETLLVIRRLHKVLRPFLLRRLKKDVEKDLPNKVEKVVKCKMLSLQSKLYRMMLKYNALIAGESVHGQKPNTIKNANNQLMQLRKICNHPFVYEEVENIINPGGKNDDTIWRVAGKFELLDRVLPKFRQTGHRVLIFFQMTQIMDIMEDFLLLRGMRYMRLDGTTKSDERTELLKSFNEPNSEYFCFLLSTRAGGLGLNLQTADTVIIFDSDWNPHQDLQAQDRAHRIGQKNEVRILRLITEDSIEEMILERAVKKLEIDGKVIQAGKFDNKSTSEEQEALLRALMEKEDERRQKLDDDDDLDDDELNQIIARNDAELEVFRQLDEARAHETKDLGFPARLYTEQELPELYRKDPELFKDDSALMEEYGRGTRERKTAVYDDNMTEEEWLKKIEGVSDELDDERKRKRQRLDRGRSQLKPRVRARSLSYRNSPVDTLSEPERERLQRDMDGIFNLLMYYTEDERKLSDIFLVKPLKKLYPDYYVLIKHPLALDSVRKRINTRAYTLMREFLEDIHLIFSNARIFNEEGLVVYQDAIKLESLAVNKYRELYQDESPEVLSRTLDFRMFDEAHLLKPLVVGGAIKQPLDQIIPTDDSETPFFDFKEITDLN